MKKQSIKILTIILIILFITLTPISSYLQIKNNVYALVLTTEAAIGSEMFRQVVVGTLISAGLVFSTTESARKAADDTIDWLKQQGFDFKDPNKPDGPNLGEVIKTMLKGAVVWSAADQLYKNIIEIPDLFWKLVKSFVDANFNEGDNIELIGNLEYYFPKIGDQIYTIGEWKGKNYNVTIYYNDKDVFYKTNIDLNNGYISYNNNGSEEVNNYDNNYYIMKINKNKELIIIDTGPTGELYSALLSVPIIPISIIVPFVPDLEGQTELNKGYGTPGIVDNPNYDWSNLHTQEREIVIPIAPDELGNNPQRDENGIMLPGIDTEHWIGITPEEIPQQNPDGEIIEVLEPGQLPTVPENPQSIPEKILWFVSEGFKTLTGIKQSIDYDNALDNPIEMGLPPPGGTGTTTPTTFDWGDFKHIFDIFFIFIYFIVILILLLVKFCQVVFSTLPGISANTDLFNDYPTILDGVNFIKNLKVGGLTITVHEAFEYVFLVFYFIFILKQLRKLYGAYVYEENERTKVESGISGANYERKYTRTNYSSINDKVITSNYSGFTKGNYLDDAIKNPGDYENINITDYTKE